VSVNFYFPNRFNSAQKQSHKVQWKDPEILQEITTEELVVSGVYLRLFVANPGWTLRKPKQFLSDLLDFIVENINRTGVEVKKNYRFPFESKF
jgi:DnaJ homolog subfamily C member 13